MTKNTKSFVLPLAFIGVMFFSLGFALGINSVLVPVLKGSLEISSAESYLIIAATFIPFLIFGYPAGLTIKKNDWILKDGEYHLSVLGVIHRPDGRFLITQRVMTKAWAPGWWEVSGGAAQAGESSFTAVCREVKEEVGLDVSQCPGGLAYTYHRENPGEGDNYFVDVYRFELDFKESDVQIQTEEAFGFKIATLDEIKELAAQGVFLHYDSIKQVFES